MGIQCDLRAIRKCRKSLLQLAMLTSIVAAAAFSNVVAAQDAADPLTVPPILSAQRRAAAIPYCDDNDNNDRTIGRRLLYVSTLDGRLTALDATKSGNVHWSIRTDPGPLISSSIHRLELTNNGQFVRMIPSLSGGIYKFDGVSIDPIPITTENLLSSSAKFSDDLVISGGKETRTYGVSARTGQLLYECSMHGCVNATERADAEGGTGPAADMHARADGKEESHQGGGNAGNNYLREHDPLLDDVIVVRRQTQTVRAVESRSGVERWNFSVGQHELDLIRSNECHDRPFSDMDMAMLDLDIKVIVPEGMIYAFSKAEPNVLLWKYQFDHPIVSGWRINAGDELEPIDMFGSAQWLWDQDENMFESPFPSITPSIYLGMYDKQLYIQESVNLRREIVDKSNLYTHLTTDSHMPVIPWRPIPASSNSLIVIQNEQTIGGNGNSATTMHPNSQEVVQGSELMPYDEDNFALSAQSVLNGSEYVNGNGFYLYKREDQKGGIVAICDNDDEDDEDEGSDEENDDDSSKIDDTNNKTVSGDLGFNLDDIDAPVKVVILSLWFWWKEVAVIALTSAVLLNLFIGQRQRQEVLVIERHVPVPTAIEATEASTVALLGPTNGSFKSNSNGFSNGHRTLSESTSCSGDHFTSRFQSDFDLERCLGRGGFGVVFEAKNKLDDCKYAVKRITLPNKKESRERVMREVKTLANCEHQNIVRYFQAWVETPPPGWQEEEDSKWLAHEMSTSIQIETPDGTTLPSFENGWHLSNPPKCHMQVERKKQLLSWVSSVASTACSSDREDNNCINEEEYEDDDSCIVFRTESESLALKEEDEENSTSEKFGSAKCTANKSKCDALTNGQKSHTSSISIDIHSNSFDLGLHPNGKNIDYTQLSDSFQIEFVRSANGENSHGSAIEEADVWTADDVEESPESKTNSKTRRRPGSLELSKEYNNNNCKDLLPAAALMQAVPKMQQNKVYLYIQMQLCRKESLRDWLRENRRDDRENHIAIIFHQIVDAVAYVHLKGLIHRDLKPSNIFFSQNGQIKIGDFGLVTDMSDIPNLVTKCGDNTGLPSCARHTQQVGTHLYMSPEQLRGQHYDFKVDIYSLGLIFFELLVYFCTEMERIVTLRDLRDGRYPTEFPSEHPREHELLTLMLSQEPEERPATSELKLRLIDILKLPSSMVDDADAAAVAEVVRRLSSIRSFSSSE